MRRLSLAFLLLSSIGLSAQQNVSAPSQVPVIAPSLVTVWTCGLNGIAASLTQCQAAPAAGLKLYITDITVQTTTTTSGTYAIQTGTGSNCATGTAALFPVSGTANRWNAPITTQSASNFQFMTPLAAPAASAICLIGVATNTISVQINGYTAP
jgi:hypothetical protein